jgi:hypothetical protein
MIQQDRMPRRFGTHASVIQLLALFIESTSLDGGTTLNACALASLLFWTCSGSLFLWRRGRASRIDLLFFRWGLVAFVLVGTPLFRPVVERWEWLLPLLYPSLALLLVMPLMYLVTRVFGLSSPFDEFGLGSPFDAKLPPPEV